MRVQKNIMIIDTETVGDFGKPLVHDIGYIIIDKDFNILKSCRHLVKNVREMTFLMNASDFYKGKKELYEKDIQDGNVDILSWNNIIKELKSDIKKYNVNCISAYNIAFDYRALNYTNKILNNENDYIEKLFNTKKFLCIWSLACDTILNTIDYKDYAKRYNLITDCGNYLTNAESCYKYLMKDKDFTESHTALNDAIIEKDILKNILENYKGIVEYGLMYNCWRKVQ